MKEIEFTFRASTSWTRLIKLQLKSWTLFTRFLTAFQFPLITNGISMICWKKCGSTWTWFDCKFFNLIHFDLFLVIRSQKVNCQISMIPLSFSKTSALWKTFAWRFTNHWSRISSTPTFGARQSSTIQWKSELIMCWTTKILFRCSKSKLKIYLENIEILMSSP